MKLIKKVKKSRVVLFSAGILFLCGALCVAIGGFSTLGFTACAQEKDAPAAGPIWPNAERVSVPLDSPAIPQGVPSAAVAMKKYGPNDWRTWQSQYFERRLKLKDDPFRSEHSSFEDVKKRGAVFNVYTGAEAQLYGMPPHSFRCLVWPGVGCERIGEQCGYANENVEAAVHHHSPITEEMITMFRGNGEGYIADHWFAMVEGGDFLFAPRYVPHGMRSAGMSGFAKLPYTKGWIGTGFATPAQWELYTHFGQLVIDHSPEAKTQNWKEVYWFKGWENGGYGLLGIPSYLCSSACKFPGMKGGK